MPCKRFLALGQCIPLPDSDRIVARNNRVVAVQEYLKIFLGPSAGGVSSSTRRDEYHQGEN
jgi:hypothetical protein